MQERSTTEYALLGMLRLRPMSGYDLRKTIAESIAYFWSESYGQIYPVLRKLAREGLVRGRKEEQLRAATVASVRREAVAPRRRGAKAATARAPRGRQRQVFELTEKGREALRAWLRQQARPRPPRNELLLKLFFGRELPLEEAARHVRDFRERAQRSREQYAAVERWLLDEFKGHPDLVYWLITLRYGQLEAEAEGRWAEEALQVLAELEGTPAREAPAVERRERMEP